MDYRRVAKDFQLCALAVQVLLLATLSVYTGYRALVIYHSQETPAVELTVKHWQGFSEWAICCVPDYEPGRYCKGVGTAGVGFFDNYSGLELWSPQDYAKTLAPRSRNLAASVISQKAIPFSEHILTCSVWNLSSVDMEIPGTFALCTPLLASWLMVKSDGEWRWVDHAGRKWYSVLRLTSYMHGSNYGYTSDNHQFFRAETVKGWQQGSSSMCAWMGIDSESEPLMRKQTTVYNILVDEKTILQTLEQGTLLQLMNLLSSVGGYFSVICLIFGLIFVKQYPESSVARTYEQRTLRGMKEQGDPLSHEAARGTQVRPTPARGSAETRNAHDEAKNLVRRGSRPPPPPAHPRSLRTSALSRHSVSTNKDHASNVDELRLV